jgi:DNA-binding HxlR family transcriptional regulator
MKSLQDRLKALESAGMITITRSATTTPRTELEITDRGRKLLTILLDLKALSVEEGGAECRCPFEGGEASDCPHRKKGSGHSKAN